MKLQLLTSVDRFNMVVNRGDSGVLYELQIFDDYNCPFDLTSYRVELTANSVLSSKILRFSNTNSGIDIVDPRKGILKIIFKPDDTQLLEDTGMPYSIKIINSTGDIKTILSGHIHIR